jgi:threonine synthase
MTLEVERVWYLVHNAPLVPLVTNYSRFLTDSKSSQLSTGRFCECEGGRPTLATKDTVMQICVELALML